MRLASGSSVRISPIVHIAFRNPIFAREYSEARACLQPGDTCDELLLFTREAECTKFTSLKGLGPGEGLRQASKTTNGMAATALQRSNLLSFQTCMYMDSGFLVASPSQRLLQGWTHERLAEATQVGPARGS